MTGVPMAGGGFSRARRRTRRNVARRAVAAALVVLSTLTVVHGRPTRADAAKATASGVPLVTLRGEGSWDAYRVMRSWQDTLYGPAGKIDFNYLANGDQFGREDFAKGKLDYAISGEPFTDAELQKLPHGADDVIEAPLQVSSLSFLVVPFTNSRNDFLVRETTCDPNDPNDPNGGAGCTHDFPYKDPVRVPSRNLAAMAFNYSANDPKTGTPMNRWTHPDVTPNWDLAKYGKPKDFAPPFVTTDYSPVSYVRSEPSSTNLYLQQFTKITAPDVWQALQRDSPGAAFEPITERLPRISVQSRAGVDEEVKSIEGLQSGGSPFPGGFIAAVPRPAFDQIQADKPSMYARLVELQNGAGEWVEPNTQTLTAAVVAGGDVPLFALTNKVKGAYPLVYVDHIYMPAHGLSIEKIEALATSVRYLVTSGQNKMASVGDAPLTKPLVNRALAAANQLVVSNCTDKAWTTVSSADPGPWAPDDPGMKSFGPMLHCVETASLQSASVTPTTLAPAPPVTTGTSPATAPPATVPVVTSISPSALVPPTAAASVASAPAAVPAAKAASTPLNSVLAVSKLPMPAPFSGSGGFDRLAAVVAGALLLFVVRRPVRWLVEAVRR